MGRNFHREYRFLEKPLTLRSFARKIQEMLKPAPGGWRRPANWHPALVDRLFYRNL
jgi:hypothetical protein